MILVLCFCLFLVLAYIVFKGSLGNDKDIKKLSWFLTALVSFICSAEGVFYALPSALHALAATENTFNFSHFVLSYSDRADVVCQLFIAFCAVDMILGTKEYLKNFSVFEGYIHHSFYIIALSLFRLFKTPNAFWVFTWCEIPTLFMALTKLGFRVDRRLFSVSFLFFRVILFDYLYYRFFTSASKLIVLITCLPSAAVLAAHSWWGYKIIFKCKCLQRLMDFRHPDLQARRAAANSISFRKI